ncbi:hypothetical protein ACHAXA_010252 [Cyclostephanos tholiformis]|uniref:Uncharacterized protein n=1 Tax=Cyclostephanos tholiformis TaxID=382380 RepID=A0ABD3SGQ7_9STRA
MANVPLNERSINGVIVRLVAWKSDDIGLTNVAAFTNANEVAMTMNSKCILGVSNRPKSNCYEEFKQNETPCVLLLRSAKTSTPRQLSYCYDYPTART